MMADQNDPRLRAAVDAYRRRDLNGSARLLEPLLAESPDDVNLLQFLGTVDSQRGRLDSAVEHLERARKFKPEDVRILNTMAFAYKGLRQTDKAAACFQEMIALNPKRVEAHIALGDLLLSRGETGAARACFEKALAIDPDSVEALINLASLCEREHRFEEAREFASRAVKRAPAHGMANVTLAQIDLRMGKAQQAARHMEHLIKTAPMSGYETALAHYLIGRAMDKLGEYGQAFAASTAGNAALYQIYETSVAAMPSVLSPDYLRKIHAFFAAEDVAAWTRPKTTQEPAPVFLLGFPRSGTTLLDQILKTHSAIETLEERENLLDVRNELVRPEGGLEKLKTMTDDEINRYRKKYWARARETLKNENDYSIIIDKMPLNTILLGLIYRLFPEAKIIFALRDPRDAVLSCFQQRFGINPAMFQFLKLDTAAAYYDQAMSIAEACRARMPLDLHVVRYEDVVGDMQKTISDVLAFLGLAWEDAIMEYRAQARERWISTPSSEQVIEPLHTSSIGKWRNYERHLAPVLPMLEPWVKKYGYDLS